MHTRMGLEVEWKAKERVCRKRGVEYHQEEIFRFWSTTGRAFTSAFVCVRSLEGEQQGALSFTHMSEVKMIKFGFSIFQPRWAMQIEKLFLTFSAYYYIILRLNHPFRIRE